jgi:hypothetical protein
MKHAGRETLDDLEDVLAVLRRLDGPAERSRGVFHLRSRAFLYFHEDPAGPFADLKCGDRWVRRRVATKRERARLVRDAARALTAR